MTLSLPPDQAKFLSNVFLRALEREHPITRAVIEAIPLTKGDYRPDPVSKSALELAWHIVAAERRFLEGIANGGLDFNPFHRSESLQNSADIGRWYGEMFQSVFPRLQNMSAEQWTKTLDFRGMFQNPAVLFLPMAMNHAIHHRGQLSVYLRPMGAKVPAIYGESYDSAEARKASQAKSA